MSLTRLWKAYTEYLIDYTNEALSKTNQSYPAEENENIECEIMQIVLEEAEKPMTKQ